MSDSLNIRALYEAGSPLLFWNDRIDPFIIGYEAAAHSGKVAFVKNSTSNNIGKPMQIIYRLSRKAHIAAWAALVGTNPFNTTTLASYFDTGYMVIFSIKSKPITYDNEVLRDKSYDINQSIFDSSSADYLKGYDLWRGTLSLTITALVS